MTSVLRESPVLKGDSRIYMPSVTSILQSAGELQGVGGEEGRYSKDAGENNNKNKKAKTQRLCSQGKIESPKGDQQCLNVQHY